MQQYSEYYLKEDDNWIVVLMELLIEYSKSCLHVEYSRIISQNYIVHYHICPFHLFPWLKISIFPQLQPLKDFIIFISHKTLVKVVQLLSNLSPS